MKNYPVFEDYLKAGITPNIRWIKKNNERITKFKKINRLLELLTLVLLYATVVSASIYTYLMLGLALVTYGTIKWRIFRGNVDKKYLKNIYEEGRLIPAILINTNPLTILAIANLNIDFENPKRYGCYTLEVKNLPGMAPQLYEKIPCTAMFGYDRGEYFYAFQPYPLCWGTKVKEEIDQATLLLDSKMKSDCVDEWKVLINIATGSCVLDNNRLLILDENYQPVGDKHFLRSRNIVCFNNQAAADL